MFSISEFGALLYIIMVGYAGAAVLAFGTRLVVAEGAPALLAAKRDAVKLAGVALLVFAGPAVLFEAAFDPKRVRETPRAYLGFAIAISAFWSFVTGLVLVSTMLALRG